MKDGLINILIKGISLCVAAAAVAALVIPIYLGMYWIAWKVYNYVAPSVSLPLLGYWHIAGIMFLLDMIGRMVFGGRK